MILYRKFFKEIILAFIFVVGCDVKTPIDNTDADTMIKQSLLSSWQEGYLDIHHINTGNGDACFMILPDGTTLLFDAGILDKERFEKKYAPLLATSTKPNDSHSTAEWIARYIKKVLPTSVAPIIDYALISHFHGDHYGSIVELGGMVPIKKVIDRNYPNYDFPLDVRAYLSENTIFQKYQSFLKNDTVSVASLEVGSDTQIALLNDLQSYPTFKVRNIKSNATIWTGKSSESFEYFQGEEMTSYYKGKYNENPLSLAIKISYGDFDYFTGGDNTGLQGYGLPYWFDVETPIAKAVGKVEVTTLNHHSNRDATNEFFVKTLNPKVVVQQSWCSDHPGQEVYQRLIYKDSLAEDRDIFATNMHPETIVTYGPWFRDNYKSMHGHIVVRVHPKGKKYEVLVLNDETPELFIKAKFGPYISN